MWLKWAGLPPAVLGLSILSKGVETGPSATQFGPACTQTMSRLAGAHLRRAERGAYPLFFAAEITFLQFLLQKELLSSFCRRTDFFAM